MADEFARPEETLASRREREENRRRKKENEDKN